MGGYIDFIPKPNGPPGAVTVTGEYADFDAAVAAAFAWVQHNGVRVINFETVYAPQFPDREPDLQVAALSSQWRQPFVRIWYLQT